MPCKDKPMNKHIYALRREKLRALMKDAALDAMLVTLDANRFYLSGFELKDAQTNESSGCLVIMADGKDILCTDARYEEAAARLWEREHVFIYGGGTAPSQINEMLRSKTCGVLGFEARCLSFDFFEKVSPSLQMRPADGLVEKLRIIKDDEEIFRLERSFALNHKLMQWVPGVLAHGRTERQVAWDIEQFYRNNGASALSFDSIVAVGPNAALPHAIPGEDRVVENCCVLVDCGCRFEDYCSDQTRTFWVGNSPPDYFLKTLELVKEAQQKALDIIRPGVTCKEVYESAWKYFDRHGVAKFFTHGLGHGIGVQTHEAPSLNSRSELPLAPGMTVTVEPGLYYPEWGGVRWEYTVLVTEDGMRIL